ncbi:SDR family NAD(P)-dependent oxidoreductase [Actinomadura darangshiensis]|uniref:SDR family NAD(P)-dependent oxidoreductase n=1 Tax=Actinomadura darangshiensis TaxID=705336 RepID=A0A4R5BX49_9ACTN|nr:SDR family NAD(P)-dependent oxidoreductase [Actinomadura darangshiensis]TDD88892.1 SDR family NAD(P)-dependent oxidoreductase [Actinomadura darangshiensis]
MGSGRVVLVTGASSGIGRAAALMFAERGFRVFGTSRRDRDDEHGVGEHGVEMLRLDVCSDASVAQCVNEVLERAGRVDVLVNNAGVMHLGFAEETTLEDADAVFAANLFGAVRVTNAVLPGMRDRRRGRVINVGSLGAWVGEPGEAFYSASKAALARYTEALRHEVWPLGISVSLVEPGAFTTGVLDASSAAAPTVTDYDGSREAARDALQRSLRRGGDPGKVAALIVSIAEARTPRYRYGAGRDGRWVPLLKVLLPQRLLDRLVRRGFGLAPQRDVKGWPGG